MSTRKDGEKNYKNIKFTYSVYGENNLFGGCATIIFHYEDFTETPRIELTVDCKTIEEAERLIIRDAMQYIDMKVSK